MLRVIFVILCYATGTVLSLHAVAFACSFFVWNELFRPLTFERYRFVFNASHAVAGVLLLSILLRKWERRWNTVATALCIVIGWVFVSSLFAQYKSVAWEATTQQMKWLIPLLIISISLPTRFGQNLFTWTLAASVGIYGAQAGYYCLMRGQPDIGMSIKGSQMSDRNDFIVGVVASLPLIAYVGWAYNWRFQKIVRLGAKAGLVFSIAAIFFSLSRGGVLGVTVLALYYMIATGRFFKRFLIGFAVVTLAIPIMPGFVMERMSTVDLDTHHQTEGSAAARLDLLKTGTSIALSHPIVGVGPNNFPYVVTSYGHWAEQDPHNIWIKAAAEYGFPMLTLFVLLTLLLLRALARERRTARRAGDRPTELLATALASSMVGFLATATFTSIFMSVYMWSIYSVAGAFLARQQHLRRFPETTELDSGTRESKPKQAVVA